jgi:DNA sulfur modification protein DndC
MSKRINKVIDEIVDQYTYADRSDRPWIIGFSGGKDSTVLLTLVWKALEKIRQEFDPPYQLKRPVYVVCNDTMVENPIISSYVEQVLEKIEGSARDKGLPIFVKKTTPKLEETFWINVIGKGYPVPNSSFRWCTDRLKIRPTSNFLHEQLDQKGEAIVLLGTRYDESQKREQSIRKHETGSGRLSKHATDLNTWVYAPIKELMTEEVWYVINTFQSPWGFDNSILFQIYADASADDYECPTVVTNKEHSSCGQSRFGCWTCTVVKKDKSMSSLVNNGQDWLRPLVEFRDRLVEERNISENRADERRNGQPAIDEDGRTFGYYRAHYRARVLRELLELQRDVQLTHPHVNLISNQELIAIQVIWNRDGIFDHKVGEIYKNVFNRDLSTNNINSLDATERRILKEICGEETNYYHLIDNLITLQESKSLMISKYGLHNDVEKRIEDFVNPKVK